jgi:flavorubredoxin
VVTTWFAAERLAASGIVIPEWRRRFVDDGDVLDTGDRALVVERPPLHTFPGTVGLLDTSTSVFWSAECWSAPFEGAPTVLDDASIDEWRAAFVRFHHWHCPWVHTVDPGWWTRAVDRVARRDLAAIVPADGPALRHPHVGLAIEALRELPMLPPVPTSAAAAAAVS